MSIEGRLVQEQHSSGVQCGGCLNPDASLGIEGLAGLKMGRREGARRGESEKVGKWESGKGRERGSGIAFRSSGA